jgi:hypothetical protein
VHESVCELELVVAADARFAQPRRCKPLDSRATPVGAAAFPSERAAELGDARLGLPLGARPLHELARRERGEARDPEIDADALAGGG